METLYPKTIRIIILSIMFSFFSSFCICQGKEKAPITFEIHYLRYGGYAPGRCVLVYKLNKNYYWIDKKHTNFAKEFHKKIRKQTIEDFLTELYLNRSSQPMFRILTHDDFCYFKSYINTKDSGINDPGWWLKDKDSINKRGYLNINEKVISLLSSATIDSLLKKTCKYYSFSNPFLEIKILYNDGSVLLIKPYLPYETTPWVIIYNNEKYYIDYYIVKTFFDNLNLGDYFYFKDLFYYIFHIETILLQDKECSDIK